MSLIYAKKSKGFSVMPCVKSWTIMNAASWSRKTTELKENVETTWAHKRGSTRDQHPRRFAPHVRTIYGYRSEITDRDAVPPCDLTETSIFKRAGWPLTEKSRPANNAPRDTTRHLLPRNRTC